MLCNSCNAVYINGILCHEHGCPEAWKDHKRECKWCGQEFIPEAEDQFCCSYDCTKAYWT